MVQDYLTESGLPDDDWGVIPTPVLPPDPAQPALTPEQAGAALHYLVSGGARLTQMTRTYHDVEALTGLLQEKEVPHFTLN